MPDPWQSAGGVEWVVKEKRFVFKDSDGRDVVLVGRLDDGTWVVQMVDQHGQERVRIGQVDDEYGIRVRNATGQVVFDVDDAGQSLPFLNLPMGVRGGIAGLGIQNSTYGGDGDSSVDFLAVAQNIRMTWGLSYVSGTYDVRVRCIILGVSTVLDEILGITQATSRTVDTRLPLGAVGQTVRLTLEARRSSGSDLAGLQVILHPINYA